MIKKYFVSVSEKGFHYIDVGSESHGRTSFRLWISKKLIKKNESGDLIVEFPLSAKIHRTEKGNFVLRPSEDLTTYDVYIGSGFRGESDFEAAGNIIEEVTYKVYQSPRGSLGISSGGFITAKGPIIINWSTSGRTYGNPTSGSFKIFPDGKVDDVLDEDLEKLLGE